MQGGYLVSAFVYDHRVEHWEHIWSCTTLVRVNTIQECLDLTCDSDPGALSGERLAHNAAEVRTMKYSPAVFAIALYARSTCDVIKVRPA